MCGVFVIIGKVSKFYGVLYWFLYFVCLKNLFRLVRKVFFCLIGVKCVVLEIIFKWVLGMCEVILCVVFIGVLVFCLFVMINVG